MRGATGFVQGFRLLHGISIHAPLAGSDYRLHYITTTRRNFNPRSPCGERRFGSSRRFRTKDFNPRSPCGERLLDADEERIDDLISIHAPLAGSDYLGRHDHGQWPAFQSTLPLRGATKQKGEDLLDISNFNPRSPCGERRNAIQQRIYLIKISIHAPLAGSDILVHFLFPDSRISIHAPLAGSDGTFEADPTYSMDFNPRSPCGERPNSDEDEGRNGIFQSTLPLRGATTGTGYIPADVPISIHAPLAGSDHGVQGFKPCKTNFNPRSPCGERRNKTAEIAGNNLFQSTLPLRGATVIGQPSFVHLIISIHAPLAGSDFPIPPYFLRHRISIHAPLAGSDRSSHTHGYRLYEFQSTLPLRGATFSF